MKAGPLETVVDRVAALRRFVEVTGTHLPAERLTPARGVVARAGERLALSRHHTVAALAGPTGSGKSSIFNALAGTDLSTVGVRRPTTGAGHACAWGPDAAGELLDWLGVHRRYTRADEDGLSGLVLLDLPDFDSVDATHQVEADRLLALADLVIWVLDPQKYADRVLHRTYLARFRHHRDIMVVALNQTDRLGDADRDRCLADLRNLLQAGGLGGVPVLATSTAGPPGLGELRRTLEKAVAARQAALLRLSADVSTVVADLQPLVGPALPPPDRDRDTARALRDALAGAAGVPLVAGATERAYRHRAVRGMGWPVTRWVRRLRPDPLRRLRIGAASNVDGRPVPATSIGPSAPAATAAVGLALRAVAERSADGLPAPWPAATLRAARSNADDIRDALDVAVATTDLGMARNPAWWRLVGGLQWLFVLVAAAGLIWLAVRYAMFALALPVPQPPHVGRLPMPTLLFLGGLLAGPLLSVLIRPVVAVAARRRRRRARARLTAAVEQVGDDLVLAPVEAVRRAYADARTALTMARTPTRSRIDAA